MTVRYRRCTLQNMKSIKLMLPILTCNVCGHEWVPRKREVPKRCAKCKSPYWDRPKEREMIGEHRFVRSQG